MVVVQGTLECQELSTTSEANSMVRIILDSCYVYCIQVSYIMIATMMEYDVL